MAIFHDASIIMWTHCTGGRLTKNLDATLQKIKKKSWENSLKRSVLSLASSSSLPLTPVRV